MPALIVEDVAKVTVGLGEVRLEAQRLLEGGDGVFQPTLVKILDGLLVVGGGLTVRS